MSSADSSSSSEDDSSFLGASSAASSAFSSVALASVSGSLAASFSVSLAGSSGSFLPPKKERAGAYANTLLCRSPGLLWMKLVILLWFMNMRRLKAIEPEPLVFLIFWMQSLLNI